MSSQKTKVAVIGVGEIGTKAHIPAYLHNENVDLTALVDADQAKLEKTAKSFRVKNRFSSRIQTSKFPFILLPITTKKWA